jgi:adenylyl- and sulfurtransferase ThiI
MRKLDRFQYPGKLLEGGDVLANSPRAVKGHLAFYEPCDVIVHVERRVKRKSRQQLGYLYGVVYPALASHTGFSIQDLDKVMKHKYLRGKILWRGIELEPARDKKELTSNEMAEFITNVILEANEMGVEVPEPDQAYQSRE